MERLIYSREGLGVNIRDSRGEGDGLSHAF